MGYNPFDVFRRHQKKLFGVLTVFVMIMFVFSFGQGDFFQWLPKLLGQGGGDGDTMATVDGKTVTDADLSRLQSNRALANEFMLASLETTTQKLAAYLRENSGTAGNDTKTAVTQMLQSRQGSMGQIPPYFHFGLFRSQNPQIRSLLQRWQSGDPQATNELVNAGMTMYRDEMNGIAQSATAAKEDKETAKAAATLIELDARGMVVRQIGYFQHREETDDNLTPALNFDLWIRKADQLGIRYTGNDAKKIFDEEFMGQLDPVTLGKLEQTLFAQRPNYNRDNLFAALADEFKVRVAKAVVIGRANAPQVFPTPYDLYEFYRKQCNGATYAVVNIPAENYLSKVTGAPDESTLRELFTKYRTVEPDPMKEGVGLKEPRKLKLGWLEAKGNEEFYKKAGADLLTAAETHAKAFAFAIMPLPGAEFGLIAAPLVANLKDPALAGAYAAFTDRHKISLDSAWFPFFSDFGLKASGPIDSSILKPANIAAAAAAAAGSAMTGAGPLTMPLVFVERSRMEDRNARARALATILVPPTGVPLFNVALPLIAALPGPLPLEVVRADILEKAKTEAVALAALKDLAHFEKELAKLGADKDKAPAKAYLAKFVADRGLKSGESTAFRDMFGLDQDPGLVPLVDKQSRDRTFDNIPNFFGRSFFFTPDMVQQKYVPATAFWDPKPFPESRTVTFRDGEPQYLAWRTEEQIAETPKDFAKTRPKVEALWRKLEARKLAAAAAEQYATDVRDELAKESGGDQTAVIQRVFGNQHLRYQQQFAIDDRLRTRFFNIENVSPLVAPQNVFGVMSRAEVQGYQLRATKDLPYPTNAIATELLANKDKKFGTVVVMHEDSKDNYYVAVLKDRQDRTGGEFYEQVYTNVTPLSGIINDFIQRTDRNAAITNALALLRAEFKVKDESEKLTAKKK